jgi:hypothetical protein
MDQRLFQSRSAFDAGRPVAAPVNEPVTPQRGKSPYRIRLMSSWSVVGIYGTILLMESFIETLVLTFIFCV